MMRRRSRACFEPTLEATMKLRTTFAALAVASAGIGLSASAFAAPDAAAAQAAVKDSGCLTCHAVDKQKAAVAFKDVAKKYKGNAEAEAKLVKHVTEKPMVEVEGSKMPHKALKDPAQAKNVAQWILSL
jgi:cytochrome c